MRPLGSPFPPVAPVAATCSRGPAVRHLHRYYGVLRLLAHPSRTTPVALVARYLRGMLVRSLHRCIPTPQGLAHLSGGAPPVARRRWSALLCSWEAPVEACPGLGTPAVQGHLALSVTSVRPSARLRASAPATKNAFGAESSRPASSLSTLRTRQLPGEWQDSLPVCPLRLDRAGLTPAGLQ